MTTNTQTGTVSRKFTAEKFGKLTLEIQGSGKYPDKVDFKTFDTAAIKSIAALGNGEEVTVSYVLQSEKLSVGGKEITETGKDGKEYAIKIPLLKVTSIETKGATASNDNVPF